MDFNPCMDQCHPYPEQFGAVFQHVQNWENKKGIEDVLEAAGIPVFCRWICGYHIHGMAESLVDKNLCVLDWYFQSNAQRLEDPSIWERYLLRDVVDPAEWWKSKTTTYVGQYVGWHGHIIGQDNSWKADEEA